MIRGLQGKDYYDPMLERWKEKHRKRHQLIDYQCLRKYDQSNEHFSMEVVTLNENEEEKFIGYNCLYRYDTHAIKLEYRILTQKWTLVNDNDYQSEEEKEKLNKKIDYINTFPWVDMGYPLDERIEFIIKLFDSYYAKLNQPEENISKSSPVLKQQNTSVEKSSDDKSLFAINMRNNQQQDSNNLKKDIIDHGLQRVVPSSAPVIRRWRVIERIDIRVEQKKNRVQYIIDLLHGRKSPNMYDLGLQFLYLYNGKFNYPQGHTIVMPFRRRIWFLTIDNIRYVECAFGKPEPRSVLILNYKHELIRVHV